MAQKDNQSTGGRNMEKKKYIRRLSDEFVQSLKNVKRKWKFFAMHDINPSTARKWYTRKTVPKNLCYNLQEARLIERDSLDVETPQEYDVYVINGLPPWDCPAGVLKNP